MKLFFIVVIISSTLIISLNVCDASSTKSLSIEAERFEKVCIERKTNCLYENARFESSKSIFIERHFYRLLRNRKDINEYNQLVKSGQAHDSISGVQHLSARKYEHNARLWVSYSGTKKCRYCVDKNILQKKHSNMYRIDLSQQINADSNSFIALGTRIYKDQDIIEHIIISAPSVFHPDDTSQIYIESRIKGRHAMTSINKGGVIMSLDGKDVPDAFPDYVSFSPVKSWNIVARKYRKREMKLTDNTRGLPTPPSGTLQYRTKWVAHLLKSYRIHYDAARRGTLPSVEPEAVIASRHGDCKALSTLMAALLKNGGIRTHIIVLDSSLRPPLSFVVPGHDWGMLHVLLYLPELNLYIDPSRIAAFGANWQSSASAYVGAVALDVATGNFVVVH